MVSEVGLEFRSSGFLLSYCKYEFIFSYSKSRVCLAGGKEVFRAGVWNQVNRQKGRRKVEEGEGYCNSEKVYRMGKEDWHMMSEEWAGIKALA